MPNVRPTLSDTLLAILLAVQDAGAGKVTRTALVKYAYLVDYYCACLDAHRETLTGTPWAFLHFGPFEPSVGNAIDDLVARNAILEQLGNSRSKDYSLYSLPEHRQPRSLQDLGLPRDARIEFEQRIRQFRGDLNALLHFVYYHTEPMASAIPGHRLDFGACEWVPYASLRPIQMKRIPTAKLQAYRKSLEARRSALQAKPRVEWQGKYDDVYFGAMKELEGEPPALNGPALIHI